MKSVEIVFLFVQNISRDSTLDNRIDLLLVRIQALQLTNWYELNVGN